MQEAPLVSIRPAEDTDTGAITAIYAHHVSHGFASFETEPPDAAEMRRRRADLVAKGLPYLVAAETGRRIGQRLPSALIETCEMDGLRQMVAVVGDSANLASILLHEKLGFRRVATKWPRSWPCLRRPVTISRRGHHDRR
jgi:phosphinothricin acetyltransferase